jgi:hypothetical protein
MANVVPSPPILVTLMMEAIVSSETSLLASFSAMYVIGLQRMRKLTEDTVRTQDMGNI